MYKYPLELSYLKKKEKKKANNQVQSGIYLKKWKRVQTDRDRKE